MRRRAENDRDLLGGTLDLLILRVVRAGPAHGLQIAQSIESKSDDVLLVEQGSLYPALHRLEERGWIRSEWGPVSYTHLRAHETPEHLVCRLLLEKKKNTSSHT